MFSQHLLYEIEKRGETFHRAFHIDGLLPENVMTRSIGRPAADLIEAPYLQGYRIAEVKPGKSVSMTSISIEPEDVNEA